MNHHRPTQLSVVVEKYTGCRIPLDTATHRPDRHGATLAAQLTRCLAEAGQRLVDTETELERRTGTIERDLAKIRHNLSAARGEPVYPLNPLGELQNQAARIDAHIAIRDTLIHHIRVLAHLCQQAHQPTSQPHQQPPTR